ncbi:HEAT repeat domain-containing protein [Pseudanabaena sp. 'Roaring Creek']|uniref:HEAT repeat domain-containing protein n=1 Tax=Pseudanabaena sp. 'Roaring Creek' TaxID=1681830 RepID=UPI0006D84458|nr:HEAT repeat domain-containing protein [Pseudanabaena sp. 'Roaring Creek']
MQVNWKKLATEIGAVDQYGTYLSLKAIEIILGEDFFAQAVKYSMSLEDGWCLSEGVLRVLRPLGMKHCYNIFKNSHDLEDRRGAVYLMKYVSDRDILNYIPEFLADPDEEIQRAIVQILDQMLFWGEIEHENIIPILESAINHPNKEVRRFAIGEVHGETIHGMDSFIENLADALWDELYRWKRRFKFETIHGFDLSCLPWHGQIKLSFQTSQEDFELSEAYSDECEWYFNTWRLGDLPCDGYKIESVKKWMKMEYEKSGMSLQCLELFLNACATAVKSYAVQNILQEYNLSPDFQVTIFNFNAAKPWKNYYKV